MRKLIAVLLVLLMTAGFASATAEDEKMSCSIVFDYTGTLDEVGELVNWIMENLNTATLTQFHGKDFVILCTGVDQCKKIPGKLGIAQKGTQI